jgi:hypothetical protein
MKIKSLLLALVTLLSFSLDALAWRFQVVNNTNLNLKLKKSGNVCIEQTTAPDTFSLAPKTSVNYYVGTAGSVYCYIKTAELDFDIYADKNSKEVKLGEIKYREKKINVGQNPTGEFYPTGGRIFGKVSYVYGGSNPAFNDMVVFTLESY